MRLCRCSDPHAFLEKDGTTCSCQPGYVPDLSKKGCIGIIQRNSEYFGETPNISGELRIFRGQLRISVLTSPLELNECLLFGCADTDNVTRARCEDNVDSRYCECPLGYVGSRLLIRNQEFPGCSGMSN